MAYFLEKHRTSMTPYVLVDEARGYMAMDGESFHENVVEWFKDVRSWLDGFLGSDFRTLTFDCKLENFNSSTAIFLLNMLVDMDECADGDRQVVVNWHASRDNEVVIGCGKVFQDGMENITFNIVVQ